MFYRAVELGPLLWSKKIHCMFQNRDENIGMYDTECNGWRKVHSLEIHKLVTPSHAGKHGRCYRGGKATHISSL